MTIQKLLCCEFQTLSSSCLDFLINGTLPARMEAQIEIRRWFCARGGPTLRLRTSKKCFLTRQAHAARLETMILLPTLLNKGKGALKVEIRAAILSILIQDLFVSILDAIIFLRRFLRTHTLLPLLYLDKYQTTSSNLAARQTKAAFSSDS